MSTVDVVIPCYRYGHYLEQAVRSALDQPGVDVRVLVIDDASPDDSADRARELARQDPRVEVRVHGTNRGHIATYNEGLLEWCRADYSVLLSADDLLAPGALARAAHYLDAHPGSGLVYGRAYAFVDSPEPPSPPGGVVRHHTYAGQAWVQQRLRRGNNPIVCPEVVVRTAVQQAVGGYDARLPHSADLEMWLRIAARTDIGFLGAGVYQACYRRHDENMSLGWGDADNGLGDVRERWAAFASFLAKDGDLLDHDADRAGRVARRKLAKDALWLACRAYDRQRADESSTRQLVGCAQDLDPAARRRKEWFELALRRRLHQGPLQGLVYAYPPTYWRPLRRRLDEALSPGST